LVVHGCRSVSQSAVLCCNISQHVDSLQLSVGSERHKRTNAHLAHSVRVTGADRWTTVFGALPTTQVRPPVRPSAEGPDRRPIAVARARWSGAGASECERQWAVCCFPGRAAFSGIARLRCAALRCAVPSRAVPSRPVPCRAIPTRPDPSRPVQAYLMGCSPARAWLPARLFVCLLACCGGCACPVGLPSEWRCRCSRAPSASPLQQDV
jgi:hypothetical protein